MRQENLAKWLKFIFVGVGICGAAVYLYILPELERRMVQQHPDLYRAYHPWLVLICITAIPCYIALVLAWKIAGQIGRDKSFSMENASYLKWISVLAAGTAGYFFVGNVILLILNMNPIEMVIRSLLVCFAGVAVAVAAAALSHLVMKAAELQEQSDLTI